MLFRLTEKLRTRLYLSKLQEAELDANPLADWTVSLFSADRTQFLLVTNTACLYSGVCFARGFIKEPQFIPRCLETIREAMEEDGIREIYDRLIAPSSEVVTFAKTHSRSVTGSMNDLTKFAKLWLAEGELAPSQVSIRLNDILMGAMRYVSPKQALRELVKKLSE